MKLPSILAKAALYVSDATPEVRGKDWLRRKLGPCCDVPVVQTPLGLRLHIHLEDMMSRSYLRADWISGAALEAVRALKPGETVLDVGANAGAFALLCAQRVQSTGRVIAVEPSHQVYPKLLRNLALYPDLPVVPLNAALANSPGVMMLEESPGHTGVARLATGVTDGTGRRVAVPVFDATVVGHLLSERRVALLKVDVEGAEVLVLQGLRDLLPRVDAAVVEVTPRFLDKFGHAREAIYRMMQEHSLHPTIGMIEAAQYDEVFLRK